MPRSDVDTQTGMIMVYSMTSTVGELIDGIRELRGKDDDNSEKISLRKAIEYVLGKKDFDWEEAILFLNNLPREETIEEIKAVGEPESKLSQKEIEALVEEYETASEKRRSEISDKLKNVPSMRDNLQQAIKRQQEIAREKVVLDKLDLERLSKKEEAREIERIAKAEKIEKDEAREVFEEAKIIKANQDVESFAEKEALHGKDGPAQSFIKERVREVIIGKNSQLEGVAEKVGPIEAKIIAKEVEQWRNDHPLTILENRLGEIKKSFKEAAVNAPEKDRPEILEYGEAMRDFYSAKSPDLSAYRNDAENTLKEGITSPGQREKAYFDAEAVIKVGYTKQEDLRNIFNRVKRLSFDKSLLPKIPEARSFQSTVDVFEKNPKVMMGLHNLAQTKIKLIENFGKAVSKLPGGSALVGKISEKIGGVAIKGFLEGSMKVMAEQGMATGAKAILQGIISGTAASAEVAGGSTLLATTIAAFQAIPVLGQILLIVALTAMAVDFVYKHILKPLYDKLNEFTSKFGLNLWGVRDTIAGWFGDGKFGRFVGTLGQFAFNAGMVVMGGLAMLFGPIMAMGLATMTAIITPVVIALVAGFMAYNLLITNPMIAALVPPPPMATGGTCEPKNKTPKSEGINCRQGLADQTVDGLTKEVFKDLADKWNGGIGKNYAEECFNDVVLQARCAGIEPKYALWVWLHESGASNYERYKDTSDFGVVYKDHNNFSEQITEFLRLNPASICINDPRVAGGTSVDKYWLAFSINFLLGQDANNPANSCDPDRADPAGNTGRTYAAAFKDTWTRLLQFGELPDDIYLDSKDQASCKAGVEPSNDHEYVAPDGTLMVCDGPVDDDGNFIGQDGTYNYDPTATGLTGEPIAGVSCSVANKVVSTKQCKMPWSNKGLPGGSGTICSAGCGPSSASSILQSKNRSLTPDTVIFRPGSAYANMNGDGSSLGQAQTTLNSEGFVTGNLGSCSDKDVSNWLREGKAVLLLTHSYTGSGNGFIGHILVAVGIDDAGIIYTKDPYYDNSTPFPIKGEGIKEGQIKDLRQCLTVQLGPKCQ